MKYDATPAYRNGIERIDDAKAVDIVGAHMGRAAFLIEVKDFRGARIRNRSRVGRPLAQEVAQKIKDSVAGIVGASRNDEPAGFWRHTGELMPNPSRVLMVVLWLDPSSQCTPCS
jgi:hypothetical protein